MGASGVVTLRFQLAPGGGGGGAYSLAVPVELRPAGEVSALTGGGGTTPTSITLTGEIALPSKTPHLRNFTGPAARAWADIEMRTVSERLADLVGRTCIAVQMVEGAEQAFLAFSDGSITCLFHARDCCETVSLNDVSGDLADLLNTPLLVA